MRFKHNSFYNLGPIFLIRVSMLTAVTKREGSAPNYRHYFGCLSRGENAFKDKTANVGLMYRPTDTTTAFGCHNINVNFTKHNSHVFQTVGRTHFISYGDSFLVQLTGVARGNDHIRGLEL